MNEKDPQGKDPRSEGMPEYTEHDFQALFKGTKGEKGEQGNQGNRGAPGLTGRIEKKAVAGYIVLALSCIVGIWGVSEHSDKQLREDINHVVKISCLESRKPNSTINKYNDFLDDQIQTNREALATNLSRGDEPRVAINRRAIARYTKDKIAIPTIRECEKPLLP